MDQHPPPPSISAPRVVEKCHPLDLRCLIEYSNDLLEAVANALNSPASSAAAFSAAASSSLGLGDGASAAVRLPDRALSTANAVAFQLALSSSQQEELPLMAAHLVADHAELEPSPESVLASPRDVGSDATS